MKKLLLFRLPKGVYISKPADVCLSGEFNRCRMKKAVITSEVFEFHVEKDSQLIVKQYWRFVTFIDTFQVLKYLKCLFVNFKSRFGVKFKRSVKVKS